MNEEHWLAPGIPAFLVVDGVNLGDLEVLILVGLNGRIQFSHCQTSG